MSQLPKGVFETGLILGGLALLSGAAFSLETKRKIWERSGRASELSGYNDRPLECMHFNHKRTNSYDVTTNGLHVTDIEHYVYHLMYQSAPHEIGLNRHQNDWAIEQLEERIGAFNGENNIFDVSFLVRDAQMRWNEYLLDEESIGA